MRASNRQPCRGRHSSFLRTNRAFQRGPTPAMLCIPLPRSPFYLHHISTNIKLYQIVSSIVSSALASMGIYFSRFIYSEPVQTFFLCGNERRGSELPPPDPSDDESNHVSGGGGGTGSTGGGTGGVDGTEEAGGTEEADKLEVTHLTPSLRSTVNEEKGQQTTESLSQRPRS